jgi:NAD(P)-dependent dehydrogenase (short-subunit alcohol dehydrogenase family)
VKGSVVNIGSMWARQAIKATPSSAYSISKAALHSLTQHLAMELAEHGVRVNTVSPAVVETPIYGAFIKPEEIRKTLAGFNAFHPIGRVLFMRSSISAKIPKRSKSAFPNRHIRSNNNVNSAA